MNCLSYYYTYLCWHIPLLFCYIQYVFPVYSVGAVFRLADGDGDSGRVEVSVDGEWGTICDMDWDRLDTRVLCRQFGYIDGEAKYV